MSLNKANLSVLANKVIVEVRKVHNKKNESVYTSDEYKNFVETNPDTKRLWELKTELDLDQFYVEKVIQHIKYANFKNKLSNIKIPQQRDIEEQIVLKTMGEDFDEDKLINNLVREYLRR